MFGSVENLQWMVDNGCPEPHIQVGCAIEYGHLDVLKWLHRRGHVIGWQSDYAIKVAMDKGYTDILEWCTGGRVLPDSDEDLPVTH